MLLGQVLLAYRTRQKLSVREMARIIGMDHSRLWQLEKGNSRNLSAENLYKILLFLLK